MIENNVHSRACTKVEAQIIQLNWELQSWNDKTPAGGLEQEQINSVVRGLKRQIEEWFYIAEKLNMNL